MRLTSLGRFPVGRNRRQRFDGFLPISGIGDNNPRPFCALTAGRVSKARSTVFGGYVDGTSATVYEKSPAPTGECHVEPIGAGLKKWRVRLPATFDVTSDSLTRESLDVNEHQDFFWILFIRQYCSDIYPQYLCEDR